MDDLDRSVEKAAKGQGGRHEKAVHGMHEELKKHKTPKDRLNAAIDTGCKNLQAMKTDGSTIDDVIEALKHVVANAEVLKAAVEHGAGTDPKQAKHTH